MNSISILLYMKMYSTHRLNWNMTYVCRITFFSYSENTSMDSLRGRFFLIFTTLHLISNYQVSIIRINKNPYVCKLIMAIASVRTDNSFSARLSIWSGDRGKSNSIHSWRFIFIVIEKKNYIQIIQRYYELIYVNIYQITTA